MKIEVLYDVTERNILHTIKLGKANWIVYIMSRNCLLKRVIKRKTVEGTGRRGRRRKQLQNNLKETRRYLKMKEKALDRTFWRTNFGRGYGHIVSQNT